MTRIWLLSLVPPLRGGRWLCGLAIAVVLLALFAAAGNFAVDPRPGAQPGVVLFFTVILAYIVPVVHFISDRAQRALDDLAVPLGLSRTDLDAERRKVTHRSRRWHVITGMVGLGAAFAHNVLLYRTGDEAARAPDLADVSSLVGTVLVWLVMTFAITALVNIAAQFARLARSAEVDLLDIAALTPFGRVAVSSTLAIIGAQAAFPLMWLDADVRAAAMIPGLIATAAPMVMIFALPVWPLHRRIVAAKRAELQRVGAWLAEGRSGLPSNPDGVARLAPLLSYRATIAQVHEWPFNAGLITRLGFYLIIPPLTWVGAALIEILLEGMV